MLGREYPPLCQLSVGLELELMLFLFYEIILFLSNKIQFFIRQGFSELILNLSF